MLLVFILFFNVLLGVFLIGLLGMLLWFLLLALLTIGLCCLRSLFDRVLLRGFLDLFFYVLLVLNKDFRRRRRLLVMQGWIKVGKLLAYLVIARFVLFLRHRLLPTL